jgi:hypothetical protein
MYRPLKLGTGREGLVLSQLADFKLMVLVRSLITPSITRLTMGKLKGQANKTFNLRVKQSGSKH